MSSRRKHNIVTSNQLVTLPECDFTHPLEGTDWRKTIDSFLSYKNAHSRPKTVGFYRSRLETMATWMVQNSISFHKFDRIALDAYISARREVVSEATLHHDGLSAKQLVKYAYEAGTVDRNFLSQYRLVPQPVVEYYVPNREDIRKLIQVVRDTWNPIKNIQARHTQPARRRFYERRNLAIVIGMVATASRISELLELTVGDVELTKRTVCIHKSKTHTARMVPISEDYCEIIRDYLRSRPHVDHDTLFVDHFGSPMTYEAFSNTWQRYRDKAGLHHVKLHSMRKHALSGLYVRGGDLKATMDMAGHKSAQTAMRYQSRDIDQLRDAYDKANLLEGIVEAPKKKRIVI